MPKTCIRTFMVSAFEGKYGDFVSDVGFFENLRERSRRMTQGTFIPLLGDL